MLKNKYYVYGNQNLNVPVHLNYGKFLFDKLLETNDKAVLINGATDERFTHGEAAQMSANLAISLSRMGVRKGATVAICSENRTEFIPTVLGVVCTGAVVTPFNISYTKDEIKHTLNISKPSIIFISPFAYKMHHKIINSIKFIKNIILFGEDRVPGTTKFNDLVSHKYDMDLFEPADVMGQVDTALILYSSGTTGLPKGVMLTHLNLMISALQVGVTNNFAGYTALSITPWFHAMGLVGTLNSFANARTLVYLSRFEEKLYLDTMTKFKVDIIYVPPPVLVLLSKSVLLDNYDVTFLKLIYCGGAPLDIGVIDAVMKRFPNLAGVRQGYGMTEATLAITRDSDFSPKGPRSGSVGSVIDGVIMKVLDLETKELLGPNRSGEIYAKGPLIMKGYVGKNQGEHLDDDGFFATGDVGFYDENGYFYIVDRAKELIKYKGFQVAPAELEGILLKHEAVQDAGVVGKPDQLAGELPMAFVVKKPNIDVTEKDIIDYIASKLSNAKHLRGGVRFLNAIPKNPSGKILRRNLREMLKSRKSKL